MIYFFYGEDIDRARTKSHELVQSLLKKKQHASFFKIDVENCNEAIIEEYIESQGLFENKYIILLDRISEDKNTKAVFISKIKEIAESQNIFIVLEGKLDKATITKIEKNSEKYLKFDLPKGVQKEEYNAFALADALGKKDKKNLWILYRKAIEKGEAPEALHGMMFWKVKTMLMNNYLGVYSKDELYNLSDKLISIYHDSRRGVHELETGLESLILSL